MPLWHRRRWCVKHHLRQAAWKRHPETLVEVRAFMSAKRSRARRAGGQQVPLRQRRRKRSGRPPNPTANQRNRQPTTSRPAAELPKTAVAPATPSSGEQESKQESKQESTLAEVQSSQQATVLCPQPPEMPDSPLPPQAAEVAEVQDEHE